MDDAEYIVLARSLVHGPAYGLINGPSQVLPTRYPFGWPLLLAPVYALLGLNLTALKLVSLAVTLMNIVLIAVGWRELGFLYAEIGLIAAALYAFSPIVVGHARMVMSEPAFLCFALICLILTTRLIRTERTLGLAIALGVTWVFVGWVRTIGLALVVISAFFLLAHRRWRAAVTSIMAFGLTLILVLSTTVLKVSDITNAYVYGKYFSGPGGTGVSLNSQGITARLLDGVENYAHAYLRNSVFPLVGGPRVQAVLARVHLGLLPDIVSVGLALLLILGCTMSLRGAGLLPSHLYVVAYLAILFVWPYQDERFLYGILPFLFTYLLLGAAYTFQTLVRHTAAKAEERTIVRVTAITAICLLLTLQVTASLRIDDSLRHVRDLREGAVWVKEHTPDNAILAAEWPEVVYLYAMRPTLDLPAINESSTLATDRPVYALLAPELKWRDDGQLEYDERGRAWQDALRAGLIAADLVYESRDAKVSVYQLLPLWASGK